MRSTFSTLLLFCTIFCFSQIQFEQIPLPDDCSISWIKKSPTGEYFLQLTNERNKIYNSTNGVDWAVSELPESQYREVMQFFTDGTPVLQSNVNDHMIRRNDEWFSIETELSFIKEDTIYRYNSDRVSYSIDYGQNFSTSFQVENPLPGSGSAFWKIGDYFLILHGTGVPKKISVINENGELLKTEFVDLGIRYDVFNTCDRLMLYGSSNYLLFDFETISFDSGSLSDLDDRIPFNPLFISHSEALYFRNQDKIYKASNCSFSFEEINANNLIEEKLKFWISEDEESFLFDYADNSVVFNNVESTLWDERRININNPYVYLIDESINELQIAVTPSLVFTKSNSSTNWEEINPQIGQINHCLFDPKGDLYLNSNSHLIHSEDNGISFNNIPLPEYLDTSGYYYFLHVLDENILFLSDYFSSINFYTFDNGQNWTEIVGLPYSDNPTVKWIDPNIYYCVSDYNIIYSKIETNTNTVIKDTISQFSSNNYSGNILLDDSSFFFFGDHPSDPFDHILYKYVYNQSLESIDLEFPELQYPNYLANIDQEIFAFTPEHYYHLDGNSFKKLDIFGLPVVNYYDLLFSLSQNNHVYVQTSNKIYRSENHLWSSILNSTYLDQGEDSLMIVPNPVTNFINVYNKNDNSVIDFTKYNIYNSMGQFVISKSKSKNQIADVSFLNKGAYIIQLYNKEKPIGRFKFIKGD